MRALLRPYSGVRSRGSGVSRQKQGGCIKREAQESKPETESCFLGGRQNLTESNPRALLWAIGPWRFQRCSELRDSALTPESPHAKCINSKGPNKFRPRRIPIRRRWLVRRLRRGRTGTSAATAGIHGRRSPKRSSLFLGSGGRPRPPTPKASRLSYLVHPEAHSAEQGGQGLAEFALGVARQPGHPPGDVAVRPHQNRSAQTHQDAVVWIGHRQRPQPEWQAHFLRDTFSGLEPFTAHRSGDHHELSVEPVQRRFGPRKIEP